MNFIQRPFLRYLSSLLSITSISACLTATTEAGVDLTDHGWNAVSAFAPDGKHIAVVDEFGVTIFDASTLSKRFKAASGISDIAFFSTDGRSYFNADATGLYCLDLSTAQNTKLCDIENIKRIYSIGQGDDMIIVSSDKPYNIERYQISLLQKDKPIRKLAEISPSDGKYVDELSVFPHKDPNTLLIYAHDQTPPKTNWDSATISGYRFLSLDLKTGKLTPVSTVAEEDAYSYGFSSMRPVLGKPEVFEIADGLNGNYDLFNPYTGKSVRTLKVPGVEFELGAPGEVISKRTVTENGQTRYFRDYLQSGTLKTIRNVELPNEETLEQLHAYDTYNTAGDIEWLGIDNKIVALSKTQNALLTEHPTEFVRPRPLGQPKGDEKTMILLVSGDYGSGDNLVKYNLETNTSLPAKTAPNPIQFSEFTFHPSEPEFFAIASNGDVHAYRIGRAGLSHVNRGPEIYYAKYNQDGDIIYATETYDYPEIVQFDASQFPLDPNNQVVRYESSPPATIMPNSLQEIIQSKSGQLLIQMDSYLGYLNRTEDGKMLAILGEHGRPNDSQGTIERTPTSYQIAPDDSSFVTLFSQEEWNTESSSDVLRTYLSLTPITESMEDYPEPQWRVLLPNEAFYLLGYSEDAKTVNVLNLISGDIESYSASDGKTVGKKNTQLRISAETFEGPNFLADLQFAQNAETDTLVMFDKQTIRVLNLTTGSLETFESPERIREIHFPAGGELIAAQTTSGQLLFYPLESEDTSEPQAVLTFYNEGNDYLLEASNGQFDASPLLQEQGVYQQGVALIPLNQIFDQSFEPTLFGSIMAGAQLPETPLEFAQIARAPVAKIQHGTNFTDTVRLKLSAQSPIGKLATVQLYLNEKLVKEFDPKAQDQFYEEYELALLPGDNNIQLIATNAAGIASSPASTTLAPPEAVNEAIEERNAKRTLHVLVVGVNEYKNPKYNLNYALPDAEGVLERIRTVSNGLYDNIEVYSVFNLDATSSGILEQFAKVQANAQPQDVFLFYFAGHGVMSPELEQFYIVPSDVTQIYGAADSLEANGISSRKLRSLAETVRAQKQIFILDACNSGGALEAFSERGATQEKAIAQLARATGTHWITASSSSQYATEFSELGHGAFTYVLLQGLDGKADSGDKRVTINELKAYLESELPRVSKEHKGSPQYPTSYGYGRDFPIAIQN